MLSDDLYRKLAPRAYTQCFTSVRHPVLRAGDRRSEIDVLMVHPRFPHLATALECKRVKISSEMLRTRSFGKLQDLKVGVAQANALWKLGFHRVGLLLILVIDSRGVLDPTAARSRLTDRYAKAVMRQRRLDKLHPSVAAALLLLIQAVDRPLEDEVAFTSWIFQKGRRQHQPAELSERVRTFAASNRPSSQ